MAGQSSHPVLVCGRCGPFWVGKMTVLDESGVEQSYVVDSDDHAFFLMREELVKAAAKQFVDRSPS